MANKKGPSFLLRSSSSRQALASSKQSSEELRSEALQNFQRRYREFNPLLIRAMNQGGSKNPRDNLASYVKFHQESLLKAAKRLGYSDIDSMPEGDRFLLSKAVSESMLSAASLKGFKSSFIKVLSLIKDTLTDKEKSGFFRVTRDEAFVSDEALTNLKINATRPALEFSRTLESLQIRGSVASDIIEQQISIAASMAKDVCFNHDSKATMWDREKLFLALIGPCMESVCDSWLAIYSEKNPAKIKVVNRLSVSKLLNSTRAAIEEDDMGHAEQVEETMLDISEAVIQLLECPRDLTIPRKARLSAITVQIEAIDGHLALAWAGAVSDIQDEVASLSEAELDRWIQNEGSRPMSLDKLWAKVDDEALTDDLSRVSFISVGDEELAGQSFFRLIQSWGLTDTLCKVKN